MVKFKEQYICAFCYQIYGIFKFSGQPIHERGFRGRFKKPGIQISMSGRGRALDNIFVERL